MMGRFFIAASVGALAVVATLSAQSLQFAEMPAGSTQPTPRYDSPIAYDPQSKAIYAFGGQASTSQNDVWMYSLTNQAWSQINAGGSLPPARFGSTLLLDPVRHRLILFGGQAGTFYSDTWAFDLGAQSWTRLSADGAGPERRYGHSAIYDAKRDRMVISHGFTDQGRYDDTWAFDFSSNSWANISPGSGRPLKRCLHHAAYDPKRDQMFLYGGCSSGYGPCPDQDLWSFNLASQQWTQLAPSLQPPARDRYGMVFDTNRDRLLMFGGEGASGLLNDTWEYDPQAQTWSTAQVTGTVPAARDRHESVFDADLGAMFFFGGQTASGSENELWMLAPVPAVTPTPVPTFTSSSTSNVFSNINGPFAPGEIVAIYGTNLGPATGVTSPFGADGLLPTSAGGVSVLFNTTAAPVYYASATQVNVQVPYEISGETAAAVTVQYSGVVSQPVTLVMQATHPGLYPGVFNQDGSANTQSNPATVGSVIVLFATGQGVTSPASPTGAFPSGSEYPVPAASPVALTVGGVATTLLFQGQAPGTAGVMQINARLPAGLTGGGSAMPVSLTVGNQTSQPGVRLWIQ